MFLRYACMSKTHYISLQLYIAFDTILFLPVLQPHLLAILPLFTHSWTITLHEITPLLTCMLKLFPHTVVINYLSGRGQPTNGALLL